MDVQREYARVLSAANHYEVLGVSSDASQPEIRKSFHSLSLILHPDKNQGGEDTTDAFSRLREAYEVLSDSLKRKQYDAQRSQAFEVPVNGPPTPGQAPGPGSGWEDARIPVHEAAMRNLEMGELRREVLAPIPPHPCMHAANARRTPFRMLSATVFGGFAHLKSAP